DPNAEAKAEERRLAREAEELRRREAEKQRSLISKGVKGKLRIPQAAETTVLTPEQQKSETPQEEEEPLLPVKRKVARRRRSLKELLQRAGIDLDPIAVYKKIFLASVVVNLLITAVTLFIGFVFGGAFESLQGIGGYLGFIAALWTVWLAGLF